MVPPALCFSSGNIVNVASEHVMLAGGVCRACVPPLPIFQFAGPCMARLGTTSRHATYARGVGVIRHLRNSLPRDATRIHIILANRRRRYPVPWTLLLAIIPSNPSPQPRQFYLYKGAALLREGPRSPYFMFYRACLYVDGTVSYLVFV